MWSLLSLHAAASAQLLGHNTNITILPIFTLIFHCICMCTPKLVHAHLCVTNLQMRCEIISWVKEKLRKYGWDPFWETSCYQNKVGGFSTTIIALFLLFRVSGSEWTVNKWRCFCPVPGGELTVNWQLQQCGCELVVWRPCKDKNSRKWMDGLLLWWFNPNTSDW